MDVVVCLLPSGGHYCHVGVKPNLQKIAIEQPSSTCFADERIAIHSAGIVEKQKGVRTSPSSFTASASEPKKCFQLQMLIGEF